MHISRNYRSRYALVIARFQVQYGHFFFSFSHFPEKQNMRNEENIGFIVRDKRAITSLSLT